YTTRVHYATNALQELGRLYLALLAYAAAADHYDAMAKRVTLLLEDRRDAASNAFILYAKLGRREAMLGAHARLMALQPSAAEKAESDFVRAAFELDRANEAPNDVAQRATAIAAFEKYHAAYKKQPSALRFVVDAAYHCAT